MKLQIPSSQGIRRRSGDTFARLRRRLVRRQSRDRLRRSLPVHAKVQLGCGKRHIEGWVNVDRSRNVRPDLRIDLRGGFPAPAESVVCIFSEHLFEHLSLEDGRRVFGDCHTALEPGGVIRVAMPDLRYIAERYLDGRYQESIAEVENDAAFNAIDSPARLLNVALRAWGHVYVYDADELCLRLRQAGFSKVERQETGVSSHPALVGRERRPESRLVVEATK
jgi:predicted SAM-dependent methyltransferase